MSRTSQSQQEASGQKIKATFTDRTQTQTTTANKNNTTQHKTPSSYVISITGVLQLTRNTQIKAQEKMILKSV